MSENVGKNYIPEITDFYDIGWYYKFLMEKNNRLPWNIQTRHKNSSD